MTADSLDENHNCPLYKRITALQRYLMNVRNRYLTPDVATCKLDVIELGRKYNANHKRREPNE